MAHRRRRPQPPPDVAVVAVTVLECTLWNETRIAAVTGSFRGRDDVWQQRFSTRRIEANKRAEAHEGVVPMARRLGISRKVPHDR